MDYRTGLYLLNILNVVFNTPDIFFTVHSDKYAFEEAQKSCELDNSFLTNIANQSEITKLLQAIEDMGSQSVTSYWIGLKKSKKECVQENLPLRGFSWIVGNGTQAADFSWKSEPHGTCTGALCGLLSLTYRGSTIDRWQLASSSCKHANPFICKHEGQSKKWHCPHPTIHGSADITQKHNDPYTLQVTCSNLDSFTLTCSKSTHEWKMASHTERDISGLCLECDKGYKKDAQGSCVDVDECKQPHMCKHVCVNTPGSYVCKCADGLDKDSCNEADNLPPFEPSHEPQDNQTPTTTDGRHPSLLYPVNTTENSVHIEENTGDLSNIIVPVIIALLIFVVLVVIIVAIVKCCLIRRSKKRAKKRAEASKESMALNGSDSMEKVNEKEMI
ncbi:C-type lectin domain family 14 member A [Salminus brasiliensis]|uniref:C-type lectin domain family 14 member A n=1 Tax=Salminus brasiliensis TaxID=930266 RepID=UPI003B8370D5